MAFQISPGVNVSEVDLTTVVPSVLTTAGAFAGTFKWGPANKLILVDSEITLSKTFGTPDSNSAVSFFTASNFCLCNFENREKFEKNSQRRSSANGNFILLHGRKFRWN